MLTLPFLKHFYNPNSILRTYDRREPSNTGKLDSGTKRTCKEHFMTTTDWDYENINMRTKYLPELLWSTVLSSAI